MLHQAADPSAGDTGIEGHVQFLEALLRCVEKDKGVRVVSGERRVDTGLHERLRLTKVSARFLVRVHWLLQKK